MSGLTSVKLNVPQQTPAPLVPGAGSPQESAVMKVSNMNAEQTALNNAVGGKIKKRGGAATIEVPPTASSSYNVNAQVKAAVSSDLNSQANAQYDNKAFTKGGSKRRRTRRRSNKKTKKTKKTRSRRYRRH